MTKKRIIYTLVSTLIVVFSTTFAILMTLERTDYRNYLQGEYSKNMYQLINSVQNIRTNLGKASIVGSKEQSIIVFEEIFRHTSVANDKLNSLPIEQPIAAGTSKFLSQVGDFCYSLSRNISEGKELSKSDYEKVEVLEVQAYELEQRLNRVVADINVGKVKWGEIRKKTSGVLAKGQGEKVLAGKFGEIQKQIVQYPALIYDGPFSDNLLEIKPKVYGEGKVSEKKARETVEKAVGRNKVEKIELLGEGTNTKISAYRFNVKVKNDKNRNIVCEVTKNGGKIIYLLDNKQILNSKIVMDKATEIGKNYLQKLGYKNMNPTYTLNYNNIAVVSYIYKQENVAIYPDQIKLKIALDNGEIIGIESEKYLIAHMDNRKIPKPKISEGEGKKRVGKNLKISSTSLVVIPTEMNNEVLCYEFNGSYKGKSFIVYIDAETGYEKKIIEIINTPNGKLTI